MKKSSLSILSLALLLQTVPALKAHEANSPWYAPFTSPTFLYPALGLATVFTLYKFCTRCTSSDDIEVIAPWQQDRNAQRAQPSMSENKVDEKTMEAINGIIQSSVNVFVDAHGPQLVALHFELANPETSPDEREYLQSVLAQLEQEAPAFATTVPQMLENMHMLSMAQDELVAQTIQRKVSKQVFDEEYAPYVETIDTLNFFMAKFVEIYGDASMMHAVHELTV